LGLEPLNGAEWQANRVQVCRSLGHPINPKDAIAGLASQLDNTYKRVAANFDNNDAIKLDLSRKHPSLTITNLDKLEEPPSLTQLSKRVTELLPKVELTGPICMYCKKIRDDHDSWQQLETYISQHSEALFSHGMCPECYKKEMEQLEKMKK